MRIRQIRRHFIVGPLSSGNTALLVDMANDLKGARRAGLATAFIARPTEYGPIKPQT